MQSYQCETCLNYLVDLRCRAFPHGIPGKVLIGEIGHRTRIRGDSGIVYRSLLLKKSGDEIEERERMKFGDVVELEQTGAIGVYLERRGRVHRAVIEIEGEPAVVLAGDVVPSGERIPEGLRRIRDGIDMLRSKIPETTE